jgi:hypothetical protein
MNVNELMDENRALRERIATLEAHIHGGIHCAFFCALPECFQQLKEKSDDQERVFPIRESL